MGGGEDLENQYLFSQSLAEGSLISSEARRLLEGVRFPWEVLASFVKHLKQRIASVPESSRVMGDIALGARLLSADVVVEEGAVVEDYAVIQGPAYLCSGVVVRSGAYLRAGVWLEHGALVGPSSEVKSSLFLPGAKAAHQAYVGDGILGSGVNLGAGTKAANLRFDGACVRVSHGSEVYDTELRKMGAVFGDGSGSGCNAVSNPGTIILPGSKVLPCQSVSGVVGRRRYQRS